MGGAMQKRVFGHIFADSKGYDLPGHLCSLIQDFTIYKQNRWLLKNVWMESKDLADTLHMCRVIWICNLVLGMFQGTFMLDTACMNIIGLCQSTSSQSDQGLFHSPIYSTLPSDYFSK